MRKHKLLLGFISLTALLFLQADVMEAQMVGPDSYIQGTSVEIGVSGIGGFEGVSTGTSPAPAGYHGRSSTGYFGFVANPQLNSWTTYDGDFFTPGSPENGWGFEIGTTGAVKASNNCSFTQQINGAITGWNHTFNCYTSDWEGDYTSGTDLHFKISYFLQQTDLYYTTTVSITNNTAATIPDMYYYRNVDPDNNEEIGGSFTTQNTIVSEPSTGCQLAHVSATQSTPWNSYLGFAATGANWRADYGGFANRDASDLWYGTGSYFPALSQVVGSTDLNDEAISLAYRIQNLAPGATETFKFVVILDAAHATAAINNLLYLSYPGSASAPPAVCTPYTDTIRTCGGPVPISVGGPIVGDFTWSWSPTTGLTPPTGPTISANPAVTTTYTATGTPLSACVAPVSLTFVVQVTPGGGVNPVITPVAPLCITNPPITLTADSLGGVYTGTGITSGTAGTFDPSVSGPGTFLITYTTSNACNSTDTMFINVSGSNPTITPHSPVCANAAAFTFSAASPGGTWSGTGITSSSAGTFDPTVSGAGVFTITYSLGGGACAASDTTTITVNPVIPPVTGFSYTTPVCISGTNPSPIPVTGFTTGGTYSVTPSGLSMSTSTGIVTLSSSTPGTYSVTYSFPATTCGPAGSTTSTITITPLIVPVTGFSYPASCKNGTNPAPVPVAGFTTGGTYSTTSGLPINDTTGVVDITGAAPGTYTVTYSVTGSLTLCTAPGTSSANFVINPLPLITMGPEQTIWIGQSTTIYAAGGTAYLWNPVTHLTCATCDSTIASPTETTTYCAIVTDANGCIDSSCVKVNIDLPCPTNRNLVVPNAFTPNGDGINDQLCLEGWSNCIDKFQILIFDRWGEKVFESSDPGFCWDGVYKGKPLDPAVFVYFIKASYATSGDTPLSSEGHIDVDKKGNISLVR